MLTPYQRECWVFAPDDRAVIYEDAHYFVCNQSGWMCLLCSAGPMLMNRVRHHRNGFQHSHACEELMKARSLFKKRIELLGHERWQRDVKEQMGPLAKWAGEGYRRAYYSRFVQTLEKYEQKERLSLLELAIWKATCIATNTVHGVAFSTMMQEIDDNYSRFVQTLEKYEQVFPISLLELAIWKAKCIDKTTVHGVAFSTMREFADYSVLGRSFDPIEYRQHKRISSNATVIIENILPFLQ